MNVWNNYEIKSEKKSSNTVYRLSTAKLTHDILRSRGQRSRSTPGLKSKRKLRNAPLMKRCLETFRSCVPSGHNAEERKIAEC